MAIFNGYVSLPEVCHGKIYGFLFEFSQNQTIEDGQVPVLGKAFGFWPVLKASKTSI